MILTESNFILYCAQHYTNTNCVDSDEFIADCRRIKYLKKLFGQYKRTGEMNERLILNHIVIMYNVFVPRACTRMLFFKLEEHWDVLKPFLLAIGFLPDYIDGIISETYRYKTEDIIMDHKAAEKVKSILKGAYQYERQTYANKEKLEEGNG